MRTLKHREVIVLTGRMLLFCWGLLLCWGLLPQAQGEAQHQLFLRISKNQLETDISDLFSEHHVLDRLAKIPVTGATSEGVAILDHLPFVREGLSKKSSGLDLSLVGDLLSGKSLPLLRELLQAGGLVIEDVKGPEVTLQILSDSLLQVTLRSKLYLSLPEILRLKVTKNIRIGVRLEHTGNKTKVVFEECHTPPGYLSIKVLEQMDPLLVNEALELVTSVLDEALPFLLQKIAPTISGPEDFQYYVTTTEFTEEAILMKVRLVTPCSPGHRPQRPALLTPEPLPKLAEGSMADLAFGLETYNDILSCLYTSKEIRVEPQDSKTPNQSRGNVRLTISTPDPPTVHIDGHTATITQPGSLMLLAPSNTSSVSVSWNLLSKAVFSSRNQELKLQFAPNSTAVTLGPYPAGLAKQEKRLEAFLLELLNRIFLPHHNELLGEQDLPLPNVKGISFDQAHVEPSKGYVLLTVPEE
ncbi:hypothetical protein VULLAG_LOCUS22422 [Vulpes lagopus]